MKIFVEDGKREGNIAVGDHGKENLLMSAPEFNLILREIEFERIKGFEIEVKEFFGIDGIHISFCVVHF